MYGYTINVSYREIRNPEFREYIKNDLFSRYLGQEIIKRSNNLDFEKFTGTQHIALEIELMNYPNNIADGKIINLIIKQKEIREAEQVYITRKDEVSVNSKFYTGEKLTWRERVEALFKGRLYGGSIEIKEKENKRK